MNEILQEATDLLRQLLAALPEVERIQALNEVRTALHEISPLRDEPVDLVLWVPAESVVSNSYNPNAVAPPEMELLRHSIQNDGYTQPIVGFKEGEHFEVVDGFHRNRVGREDEEVKKRILGHLPVVCINDDQKGLANRMASTVRHNRARGKHAVVKMSDIVVDLARRKWTDEKIAKELGMEPDEVLRLKQITGLAELFTDREFSKAWEVVEVEPS